MNTEIQNPILGAIATEDQSLTGQKAAYAISIDREDPEHLACLEGVARRAAERTLMENVISAGYTCTHMIDGTASQEGFSAAIGSMLAQLRAGGVDLTSGRMVCVLSPGVRAKIDPMPEIEVWDSPLIPDCDADHVSNLFAWIDDETGSPIRYTYVLGETTRAVLGEDSIPHLVIPYTSDVHVSDHKRVMGWVTESA